MEALERPEEDFSTEAREVMSGLKRELERKKEWLSGPSGFNGEINWAWRTYENLKEIYGPEDDLVKDALKEYERLDEEGRETRQCIDTLNHLITVPRTSVVERERRDQLKRYIITRVISPLEAQLRPLKGPTGFDGSVDRAWKVLEVVRAHDAYFSAAFDLLSKKR